MITITIFQRASVYAGFESKGHAGYAEEGYDIICAAVSALTVNTVNSVEQFTSDEFSVKQEDGYLSFLIKEDISRHASLLMESLVLGLRDIQDNYGNEYIELRFKEV